MTPPFAHVRTSVRRLRQIALADVVTLGNGAAGMGSILASVAFVDRGERWLLWVAIGLLPIAAACDFADGKIARWRHQHTALGAQLDSLADLISFGVAPAVLGFAFGLRGGWDALVLIFFVSCGLSRLARYNVTAASLADDSGKVAYFEGAPIPTSILIVLSIAALFGLGRSGEALPLGDLTAGWTFHPFVLSYAVLGTLMVTRGLRIPKP